MTNIAAQTGREAVSDIRRAGAPVHLLVIARRLRLR
jgi:hypothetical protein